MASAKVGRRRAGIGRRLLAVLAGQLGLGVALVVLALPLPVAVLHNLGAVLLMLCLVAAHHHSTSREGEVLI